MSEAMEQIVSALVRLKDKHSLEKLRDHRRKLADDLNELQSKSEFNLSLLMGTIAIELGVIEAGLEQLQDDSASLR
ncbi:hypothetical protein [Bradyrhizobium erythrophlei]|uniref:Uncharacterized protein n=1 Tax=Bradyrhizobium erythrophlei TaxID=1437360 RepID=A0A1M7T737_9BRAD|nr:hypothetical protein [Bradyrhizobium erythrophlei]SHN66540.1 hypothetical protein SAMN05444170_0979 [Bradyrhizobium erythrophlei]